MGTQAQRGMGRTETRDARVTNATSANERTSGTAGTAPHTAQPGAFLPFSVLVTKWGTWVGLACLLAWINLLICFEGVLRDAVNEEGGLVHDPVFLALTLCAGTLTLAYALLGKTRRGSTILRAASDSRLCGLALCVLGTLAAIGCTVLAGLNPHVPRIIPYLLGAAIGVMLAWELPAWGRRLSALDLRESLLLVSLAACLQWLPFIGIDLIPLPLRLLIVAALPLASHRCLLCAGRCAEEGPDASTVPASRPARLSPSGGQADAPDNQSTLMRMSLAIGVFSLAIQFFWSYFIKMLPGKLPMNLFPGVFAVVAVLTLLAVGLCVLIMERQRGYRLEFYYRAALLFCLCGVTATGVAASSGIVGEAGIVFVPYVMVYVGYSLVSAVMWPLALGYAFMRRAAALRVFCPVLAGQFLGQFAGFLAVEAMEQTRLVTSGPQLMSVVLFAGVLVLGLAYTTLFPERSLISLSPLLFGMSSESIDRRCEAVARAGGLTPRETEILELLARGRDVAYVSSALGIARNTASAHRKNIYAKLDIHSQQELLSVVEGAER